MVIRQEREKKFRSECGGSKTSLFVDNKVIYLINIKESMNKALEIHKWQGGRKKGQNTDCTS